VKRSDLEKITPHGDDFDSPDSTFAQDSVACVDAALVALSSRWKTAPAVVEFAIEPVQIAVCQKETGFEDLGTGPEAEAWENAVVDNPKLKDDLALYSSLLNSLESKAELSKQDISELRELARNTKWTREKLLP